MNSQPCEYNQPLRSLGTRDEVPFAIQRRCLCSSKGASCCTCISTRCRGGSDSSGGDSPVPKSMAKTSNPSLLGCRRQHTLQLRNIIYWHICTSFRKIFAVPQPLFHVPSSDGPHLLELGQSDGGSVGIASLDRWLLQPTTTRKPAIEEYE